MARTLAQLVMVLSMLLASSVATGVMPSRGTDGTVTLVLCDGEGMQEIVVDAATMQPLADQDRQDNSRDAGYCSWAAAHPGFALPALIAAPPPLAEAPARISFAEAATALIAARATGLPPSTGPPLPA